MDCLSYQSQPNQPLPAPEGLIAHGFHPQGHSQSTLMPRRRLGRRCAISAAAYAAGAGLLCLDTKLERRRAHRDVRQRHGGARKPLVDCDEARRRLVYAVVRRAGEPSQRFGAGPSPMVATRSRLIWIVDVLADTRSRPISIAQMDQAGVSPCRGPGASARTERRRLRLDRKRANRRSLTVPGGACAPRRASVPSASGSRSRQDSTPSTTIEAAASTKKFAARRVVRRQPPAAGRDERPAARSAPAPGRSPWPRPARRNTSTTPAR